MNIHIYSLLYFTGGNVRIPRDSDKSKVFPAFQLDPLVSVRMRLNELSFQPPSEGAHSIPFRAEQSPLTRSQGVPGTTTTHMGRCVQGQRGGLVLISSEPEVTPGGCPSRLPADLTPRVGRRHGRGNVFSLFCKGNTTIANMISEEKEFPGLIF